MMEPKGLKNAKFSSKMDSRESKGLIKLERKRRKSNLGMYIHVTNPSQFCLSRA